MAPLDGRKSLLVHHPGFVVATIVLAYAVTAAADVAFIRSNLAEHRRWQMTLPHGVIGAAIAVAFYAAFGTEPWIRRLAWSALGGVWSLIVLHAVFLAAGFTVGGFSFSYSVLAMSLWAALGMVAFRSWTGYSLMAPNEQRPAAQQRWQFHIRSLVLATVVIGVSLAAIRLVVPPWTAADGYYFAKHSWKPASHVTSLLNAMVVAPVPLALVFRLRWLPAAIVVAVLSAVLQVMFMNVLGGKLAMTSLLELTGYSLRYAAIAATHSIPSLAALRLVGLRLIRTDPARAPALATG